MITAEFVRDITEWGYGNVKMWKLSEPYVQTNYEGVPEFSTQHVATSAAFTVDHGNETYIFPVYESGGVISWGELPGSYVGGLDHQTAINGLLDHVNGEQH